MPYAIPIGVFVALLGLIPYIGNLLCLIPAVIISMVHFSQTPNQIFGIEQVWVYPLIVIGIFFVTQQLNSLVTAPKIVGDSVGLHPLTVIFSVLFWAMVIGGFLGSLLAVPLTASVKVLFRRYIWEMKFQRELLEPQASDADRGGGQDPSKPVTA
jgi:predicted PurR-regulated permease PerM